MSYKKLYEVLLESGELQDFCPNMTGVWEKDKKSFIEQQEELESLTKDFTVDIDGEEEYID